MDAVTLFDEVQKTIQSVLDKHTDQNVYLEREMRGTYPTMIIRVLPSARDKKPRRGAIVLSSKPKKVK